MYQPVIENSYLVELNMPGVATGQTYTFQNIPDLRGQLIYGVQAFCSTDIVVSPTAKSVVTVAGAANILVTFVVADVQENYQFSYLDLRPGSNSGLIRMFKDKRIDLTKSFASLIGVVGLAATESMMFNFIYRDPRRTK